MIAGYTLFIVYYILFLGLPCYLSARFFNLPIAITIGIVLNISIFFMNIFAVGLSYYSPPSSLQFFGFTLLAAIFTISSIILGHKIKKWSNSNRP